MGGWGRLILAMYFLGTMMAIPGSFLLVAYNKSLYQQQRMSMCNVRNSVMSQDSCEQRSIKDAESSYGRFPYIQMDYFVFIDSIIIVISILMSLTVVTVRWVRRGFDLVD